MLRPSVRWVRGRTREMGGRGASGLPEERSGGRGEAGTARLNRSAAGTVRAAHV